jgi:hypothetical protein
LSFATFSIGGDPFEWEMHDQSDILVRWLGYTTGFYLSIYAEINLNLNRFQFARHLSAIQNNSQRRALASPAVTQAEPNREVPWANK